MLGRNRQSAYAIRTKLYNLGMPATGKIAATLERYELAAAKLQYLQVQATCVAQGLHMAPMNVAETPQQLQAIIEADGAVLEQYLADLHTSGVGDD